ncbi:MAG: hypothetical protein AAF684_00070 [Pseudomonadota bacterium]
MSATGRLALWSFVIIVVLVHVVFFSVADESRLRGPLNDLVTTAGDR